MINKLLFGLFFFSAYLFSSTLSLRDFLNVVRAQHPFYNKIKHDFRYVEEKVTHSFSYVDLSYKLKPSAFHKQNDSQTIFMSQEDAFVSISNQLEKKFFADASSLRFSYDISYINQQFQNNTLFDNGRSFSPSTFYRNSLLLNYTKPLMKDKNALLTNLPYRLAKIDRDLFVLSVKEKEETFLLNLISQYLEWVFFYEKQLIASKRLLLADKQKLDVKKRVAASLADELDLLQAKNFSLASKRQFVQDKRDFYAKNVHLATTLGDDKILTFLPDFDFYDYDLLFSFVDNLSFNLGRLIQEKENRTVYFDELISAEKNKLLPVLNVSFDLGFSDGQDDFSSEMFPDKPYYGVNVLYEQNVKQLESRSKLRLLVLEKKALLSQYDSLLLDLKAKQAVLFTKLNQMKEIIFISQEQIDALKMSFLEEKRRYAAGRSEFRAVIQASDSLESARLALLQYTYEFWVLYFQTKALLDQKL